MDHELYDDLLQTSGILTLQPRPDLLTAEDRKVIEQALAFHQDNYLIHEANAPSQWIAGRLCQWLARTQEAIKYFTKATVFDPHFTDAYRELSLSLWLNWDLDGAEIAATKAVELNGHDDGLRLNLAIFLACKGSLPEAEEVIVAAKDILPPEQIIDFLEIVADLKRGDVPAPQSHAEARKLGF